MTSANFAAMELDVLRRYVLAHREDVMAFQAYVDRSKAEGRMMSIAPQGSDLPEALARSMPSYHHPEERDYFHEEVEVESSTGQKQVITASLLRVYPESFNGYDAYLDILASDDPSTKSSSDIRKVTSPRLGKRWEVTWGPKESLIQDLFRGDFGGNVPPAVVMGLRLVSEDDA